VKKEKSVVIKASGEKEPFLEEKLKESLLKSGTVQKVAKNIVASIKKKIKGEVRSSDIRAYVFDALKKEKHLFVARYNLRRGVMELGPTGYPFEKFVAEIFELQGYKTKTNQIVSGKCVKHEIDIIAEKNKEYVLIEAKFHNQLGIKSDVKIAMYVYARFLDIEARHHMDKNYNDVVYKPLLITNTKLTSDAIQYARCVGMKIIAWNYPKDENLQFLVEHFHLHPITSLVSLTNEEKEKFFENGIVLCKQIYENESILRRIGIKDDRAKQLSSEIHELMENY